MKYATILCALLFIAPGIALAEHSDPKGAQHDIGKDRNDLAKKQADAAQHLADGDTQAAAKSAAKAAAIGADIAGDLAGCPSCH